MALGLEGADHSVRASCSTVNLISSPVRGLTSFLSSLSPLLPSPLRLCIARHAYSSLFPSFLAHGRRRRFLGDFSRRALRRALRGFFWRCTWCRCGRCSARGTQLFRGSDRFHGVWGSRR